MSALPKEAPKLNLAANDQINTDGSNDSRERVRKTYTHELVIALCGPIGSPIHEVCQIIFDVLDKEYGYECEVIRLSDFIKKHKAKEGSDLFEDEVDEYTRISESIAEGDALRNKHGNAILAELAINQIAVDRERFNQENKRSCYIINSIKHEAELDILRHIYGEILFSIGVFSPVEERVKNLENRGVSSDKIYQLMDRDSGEEMNFGQRVSETFPLSDIFIRVEEQTNSVIEEKVRRYLDLIFGTKVITPSQAEAAMYAAAAAANNSACLSRQVGASITDQNGVIISVGWNDVPRFGGGLYSNGRNVDNRCWNKGGKCYNDNEKSKLARLIADELISAGLLHKNKKQEAISSLQRNYKLKGLIEFSRAVHAEMHAIVSAGRPLSQAKLYCTTYPCHSCARHIVAAGIEEVYYIEPYRKSLATSLHHDSITENEKDDSKLRLLAYEGVSPRRYLDLFSFPLPGRKKDGKIIKIKPQEAIPRHEKSLAALKSLEAFVTDNLNSKSLIEELKNEK
ncbi:anti-phage dCTP deaminase [Chromobacterium sphagni]|uniref:anti-phage dCTP deaminase n=1 Tax=Chromobacterium sphagni TaxID=1903179 RepID=UPI0009F643FC|nr:anti-phage dCTP deaminase [Chromobacterium sphagni]